MKSSESRRASALRIARVTGNCVIGRTVTGPLCIVGALRLDVEPSKGIDRVAEELDA